MVSLYVEGSSVVIDGHPVSPPLRAPPPPTTPWSQRLTDDLGYLVDEVALPVDDGASIAAGIRNGSARAVSDGSYKDGYGTAAGCVSTGPEDDDMLYFVTSVPGVMDDQNSYRSELAGVLGVMYILEALCSTFHIQSGTITVALDGKEALNQASYSNSDSPLQAGQACFDLLQPIRRLRDQLPILIKWQWVEGHQAEKGKTLDWWGNQNCIVDTLAKAYWNTCQRRGTSNNPRPLHHEPCYVIHEGTKLSRFHQPQMYNRLYGPRTLRYWQHKTHFSSERIDMIMWPAAGRAMARLPFGLQRFWLKFATGFLGTAHKLHLRGYQDHEQCPRCGEAGEDNVHVLRCPQTTEKWRIHQSSLLLKLRELQTAPDLANAIIRNLDAWRENTAPFIPTTNTWGERDAVLAQQSLGWTNFAFGRWHRQWATSQHNYLRSLDSKCSLRRWTSALIHKLYMTAWDFWDHRNKVLHAPAGPRALATHEQLNASILAEFDRGPTTLNEKDTPLMHTPPATLLTGTVATKRRWLHSVQLSRALAQEHRLTSDQRQLQRQQTMMQRWLRQQPPPQHPNP